MTLNVTADDVRNFLDHPYDREWSIQGFGMLRTYLDADQKYRLHIWDPQAAVEEVSSIHDHPWDFTSEVISGQITNVLFLEDSFGLEHMAVNIRCGVGGGMIGTPEKIGLHEKSRTTYIAGMGYSQHAEELHMSLPAPGTVTLITRHFRPDNRDIARVIWPKGDWVSAEPRPATEREIMHFTGVARKHWFPRVGW